MNKITVTTTQSIETQIEVPKYFICNDDVYRADEDNRFTRIMNLQTIQCINIQKGVDAESIHFEKGFQEISDKQFKAVFCAAIADIAGFDISVETWATSQINKL